MRKTTSSCNCNREPICLYRQLVSSLHARLAPFTFLANLSLLLLLARALECLRSSFNIFFTRQLLQDLTLAFHALKHSCFRSPEIAIYVLLHFVILGLFLTVGRSADRHNSGLPSAGAPAALTELYEVFNDLGVSEEYSQADHPASSHESARATCIASAPYMDARDSFGETSSTQMYPEAIAELQVAIAGTIVAASAPSWELAYAYTGGSMRANGDEVSSCNSIKEEILQAASGDDENADNMAMVAVAGEELAVIGAADDGSGRMSYNSSCPSKSPARQLMCLYAPSSPSTSPLRLDSLTREEANEHFSQFQARTWAKIRSGGRDGSVSPLIDCPTSSALVCA
ncbi:hypothetical protein L7F22_023286 [Adiantum nelumboides]|nr:hypothetical protein [Adiantum nelumboides]